ncbi:MAG: formimidoylglutamate deiminase [Alphaproteobacteria bacterium]
MAGWLRFDHLLTPEGWVSPGWLQVDKAGAVADVAAAAPNDAEAETVAGFAIPGMANLHSHAFQRAMAGLAEHRGSESDSFWTWRETMYRFVSLVTPEDLKAIAAQLYVEMLKAGYTAVAEFHYVHHAPDGAPYGDRATMSNAVFAAARAAGIGLTHLPVLYAAGGFGGKSPGGSQRRFLNDVDGLFAIIDAVAAMTSGDPQTRTGLALHSLRAVPPDLINAALDRLDGIDDAAPIHIHVAEQHREVEDCLSWSGKRPVDWLLDNAAVDARWCLVHATHMEAGEVAGLAKSGAVAGLCPTTEANLGDGLFPLRAFLDKGGRLGIGSDSHISVSPVEELRWLEYGQRLVSGERNVAGAAGASTGRALYEAALAGGAQACGRPVGSLAPGRRADLVVLDAAHPVLAGLGPERVLDAHVFSGNTSAARDVMVGGSWVVRDGRHEDEDRIEASYRLVVTRLVAAL